MSCSPRTPQGLVHTPQCRFYVICSNMSAHMPFELSDVATCTCVLNYCIRKQKGHSKFCRLRDMRKVHPPKSSVYCPWPLTPQSCLTGRTFNKPMYSWASYWAGWQFKTPFITLFLPSVLTCCVTELCYTLWEGELLLQRVTLTLLSSSPLDGLWVDLPNPRTLKRNFHLALAACLRRKLGGPFRNV